MSDEGFREIQLNGKQLIFLFMAATVMLVVTFLFGVLVGRGARDGSQTADAAIEIAPDASPTSAADTAAPPPAAASAEGQPPVAQPPEKLTYTDRLLRDTQPEEQLKSAPVVQEPVAEKRPPPAPPKARATEPPAPAPRAAGAPPAVPAAAAAASDPSGPGFAVQVAAYRDRRDADTLAKQLTAKGYPAFVMDPVKGTSTALFRVRVGKYKTLKDAEAIEVRLQTAEQLTNAWIAR